jgi:hypothetical protein
VSRKKVLKWVNPSSFTKDNALTRQAMGLLAAAVRSCTALTDAGFPME